MNKTLSILSLGLAAMALSGSMALASGIDVQVGYADGLRGPGFFPNPWDGDPGVQYFLGHTGSIDDGAIRIVNNTGAAITLHDAVVNHFDNGASYQLWGASFPLSLDPGKSLILTATSGDNFDTSDQSYGNQGSPSLTVPHVLLDFGSGLQEYDDTGLVLNTNGYDQGAYGINESFQWRTIGTSGTKGGDVPEPGTVAMLVGLGVSGAGFLLRRRK